jgi:8-oxo-dGTP pyrophosphatase MutT (NUDIX family)
LLVVTKPEPAPALPSATILLVRDAPDGLEVFMVVRHHEIDTASGASVFPGGKLAEGDSDPQLRGKCDGAEGFDDGDLALAVAAIRESFEECGVLLARREGEAGLLDAASVAALQDYRAPFETGALAMADFVAAHGLRLACDVLVPFARWITPAPVPKRFDTHFYLTAAPADQAALHDGGETVDSIWIRPKAALVEANAGTRPIVFPTRLNLMWLAQAADVKAALTAAQAREVVPVQPEIEDRGGGDKAVRIPAEAGYPINEVPVTVARGGAWPDGPVA